MTACARGAFTVAVEDAAVSRLCPIEGGQAGRGRPYSGESWFQVGPDRVYDRRPSFCLFRVAVREAAASENRRLRRGTRTPGFGAVNR